MMKQLTINQIAAVNGASNFNLFLSLFPVTVITAKGLALCYELNKKPASIIPTVTVVALFSVMGAGVGYNLYHNDAAAAIGSAVGGVLGSLVSIKFGLDVLQ